MNWLTSLAFAVLLLSVQYDAVQSVSSATSRSPWADPAKAGSIMNCLTNKIASSNVLPQQEKEDLESIMDTLMSAIKGASAKGQPGHIAVKTQALTGALGQCFQAVMGTVDRKFINEINDLIRMFASKSNSDTNEIPDQGASYGAGSSASSTFQKTDQNYQASTRNSGSQFSQAARSQYSRGGESSYNREKQFASNTGQTTFGQTSTGGQISSSQAGGSSNTYSQRASSATSGADTKLQLAHRNQEVYTSTVRIRFTGNPLRSTNLQAPIGSTGYTVHSQDPFTFIKGILLSGSSVSFRADQLATCGFQSNAGASLRPCQQSSQRTCQFVNNESCSQKRCYPTDCSNVAQKPLNRWPHYRRRRNNLFQISYKAIYQCPAGSDTLLHARAFLVRWFNNAESS
ncbi:hypothetical protein HNY73_007001 [Argiope bruennichi]|uniref:Spidroin N-terminal domain-containing protein n=1 Tax=Argiope bruennichi TaxID=94029 RepID=A0A8T0FHN6_ARGBR|nr:hypothetical protein HNY73_007001 [Argiope bruennichi]